MTRANIHLASNLSLPPDAATETFAILARKDGGKTYTGLKLFEEMHRAGAQCVAIDPVGKWWALRLDADGKSPGIDLPIFGGLYADLPLEPTGGALIAKVVVDRGISAVIDVSLFEDRDMKRFVTDFARELYRLKQRDQSVMHVFFEEASTFLPQDKEDGADPPMLSAMKKIVRKGRNYGIGSTMIDQRAQDVNKKVLNQASILVVLGTSGSTDRKAIETWIRDKHIDVSGLDELASLEQGEAFVWLPREKTFKRVRVAKRWTYDASATPKLGAKRVERKLAPADVSALREAMKDTVARAEAEDPKYLRKKIAELEKQLRGEVQPGAIARIKELEKQLAQASADAEERISNALRAGRPSKMVEKPVVKAEQIARLEKAIQHLGNVGIDIKRHVETLSEALEKAQDKTTKPNTTVIYPSRAARAALSEPAGRALQANRAEAQLNGEAKLKKGAREMLQHLAAFMESGLTRAQLATFIKIKPGGSTLTSYLSSLRTSGCIREEGERVWVTEAGMKHVGAGVAQPTTTAELVAMWKTRLKHGARLMLDKIVEAYPGTVTREELAELLGGVDPRGSTLTSYLSSLRTNGLMLDAGDDVCANASLFPGE